MTTNGKPRFTRREALAILGLAQVSYNEKASGFDFITKQTIDASVAQCELVCEIAKAYPDLAEDFEDVVTAFTKALADDDTDAEGEK